MHAESPPRRQDDSHDPTSLAMEAKRPKRIN
jgi:hypothetical protein